MVQQKREKFNNAKLDTVLARLRYEGPRPRNQYLCHCPAHDDHNPSLSVTVTEEGKILLHCFAGCEIAAVLSALGLTWRDLMPQGQPARPSPSQSTGQSRGPISSAMRNPSASSTAPQSRRSRPLEAKWKLSGHSAIVATYEYCDINGGHVCEVVRYEPKTFRQRRRVNGEWVWSLQGVQPPLYRLPELHTAPRHAWVYIVEGEKDVETLRRHGLVATCNIQGAGKWKREYNCWLTNRLVCILPDNDEVGRAHAQVVAEQLQENARQVQILELPNLPEKGDVSDWFAAGGNDETLEALLNQALYERWLLNRNYVDENYVNCNYVNVAKDQSLPYLHDPYPRDRKGKGRPHTTEYLSVLVQKMHYEFALNELDDTIELNGRQLERTLEANIGCRMRDLGYKDMKALQEAYTAYAGTNGYHPVKRFLKGLTWDGQDHLAHLVSHLQDNHTPIIYDDSQSATNTYQGEHQGDHKARVAKVWLLRFLVGAVARVFDHATISAQPPMLVLDGRQGIGKSTLVRWLGSPLPNLTYEGSINPTYKETPRLQATKWIWEVPELGATTRHADREALKAIISAGAVTFRVPYSTHLVRKPTLANFIGTINNEAGFLSDPTGNRRFLAMTLTHIDHAYERHVDINQLWAQIYALYLQGEPWQLFPVESEMQTLLNQAYQVEDPLETWIERYYECDPGRSAQYQSERNPGWFVTTQEIAVYLTSVGFVGNTTSLQQRLATTLKAMGLQDGRKGGTRGLRGYYGLRRRNYRKS